MSNREERIETNQEIIRALNPDAKVEYPVEYALLDNNAVFVAARIINSMGFDFFNYEDIFKQDFLAKVGIIKHYEIDDEYYFERGIYLDQMTPLFFRIRNKTVQDTTFEEAMKYNEDIIHSLYPTIWKYCSDNIKKHFAECVNIDQNILNKVYSTDKISRLYDKLDRLKGLSFFPFLSMIGYDKNIQLSEEAIAILKEQQEYIKRRFDIDDTIAEAHAHRCAYHIFCPKYNTRHYGGHVKAPILGPESHFYETSLIYTCALFEQLTISLVKDCCMLINQIKMNTAAGRDPMYPLYDNTQLLRQQVQSEPIQLVSVMPGIFGKTNRQPDITQDAINEMAATAEPGVLSNLSAEELMPSFQENPYTKVEAGYTDIERDIVRYIVQDMIDAAKAV